MVLLLAKFNNHGISKEKSAVAAVTNGILKTLASINTSKDVLFFSIKDFICLLTI
jgi:hypothetical protein